MYIECKKCKKEMTQIEAGKLSNYGLCYDCSDKADNKLFWKQVAICVMGVVLIIGFRVLWAKVVYKDSRCAWAECRIQVNP